MKVLLLRQANKKNFAKKRLLDSLGHDVYEQLAIKLAAGDRCESWFEGSAASYMNEEHNFVRRWVPKFNVKCDFRPDVIIARGGYREYAPLLVRYKRSFRVSYGAGASIVPQYPARCSDLVLVDTPKQRTRLKRYCGNKVRLWAKPASEVVFFPFRGAVEKDIDLLYVSNLRDGVRNKGHEILFPIIADDIRFVHVGRTTGKIGRKYPHINSVGHISPKELNKWYARSKAAVTVSTPTCSCDCVIPETLACDCPLLAGDWVPMWHKKFITSCSGMVTNRHDLRQNIELVVGQHKEFRPYKHYKENMSLDKTVEFLKQGM